MGAARRITLRVNPPTPLGDVAMVPQPLSGRSEAEMARAMAAALAEEDSATAADVYSRVRQAFPQLLVTLETPATAPKPCGRSPGRPKGARSGRAPRCPALKKAA